ncbi:MAG: BREX-1 system adenine-specific DNA-methyltransferase PglX, partial [Bacteroidales bacterium]
ADLLDGRVPAENPHQEVYRLLLVASCNHWNARMPFLFEHIADYTELLLPDDLLSPASILTLVREEMRAEDCTEEEIIGWLYQFYISEKKDEVFARPGGQKIKAEEIPAATQLFTPRWIVRYMVENTLGKLWLRLRPHSALRTAMPYYIDTPADAASSPLPEGIKGVEDIRFIDPCMGSGHVLVYAFELFTRMYEEEGYAPSEIPNLIFRNNLFGLDIDPRAAQLAAFALTMKARGYYSRYFRRAERAPQLFGMRNFEESLIREISIGDNTEYNLCFIQLNNLGSFVCPLADGFDFNRSVGALWQENVEDLKNLHQLLSGKYHCVVTNPPYMGSKGMNDELKEFVNRYYPESKADLMAVFMERCLKFAVSNGKIGMINQHSWMFLSSYEELRKKMIANTHIESLLHLGPRAFAEIGGEVVQNAAFVYGNYVSDDKGVYLRLVDFGSAELKEQKTLEAIAHPDCGWFYLANQKDFEKIPGCPIGYWVSEKRYNCFNKAVDRPYNCYTGLICGNNISYLRSWYEVNYYEIDKSVNCLEKIKNSSIKWVPINHGGKRIRWYGEHNEVVLFQKNAQKMRLEKNSMFRNEKCYFLRGITWNRVGNNKFAARISLEGFVFEDCSPIAICSNNILYYTLALFNSKPFDVLLRFFRGNIKTEKGHIESTPFLYSENKEKYINTLSVSAIALSKQDWDSHETSWDFQQNELIRQNKPSLSEAWEAYQNYWSEQFHTLHQNEEELNRQFIEIYGLEGELTPDVPLEEITILQQGEIKIEEGTLRFQPKAVIEQLVSYGVGCILGRYSFDKPGLILANQGETLEDYLAQVPEPTFMPDADNIVPVLEKEYFADDLVGEFKRFIGRAFGEEQLHDNLRFIEEALEMDLRKYFNKNFYTDHIKRYKKRSIYWMFASPKGYFKVLCYMHRMRPDTPSKIASDYLQPYLVKLEGEAESLRRESIRADLTPRDRNRIAKELDELAKAIKDCRAYEKTLLEFASTRTTMDLDDGVRVNYTKFKTVVV